MSNVLSSVGKHQFEIYAILMGVLGVLSSVFFFLVKYNIITVNLVIADNTYLFFFAAFTGISGIIHLLTTVGLIGTGMLCCIIPEEKFFS